MTCTPTADLASAPGGLMAAWRWWLPPALLAFTLALIFLDPFAGDWDALDYTVLALRGEPSSMLFGRMLFIFTNHALWCIAHALINLQPDQAYLLFKYAVVVQSPLAVIACWALARELSGCVRTATIAALLLTLSPFFIIYSGQAMTEIPSLLLLSVALTIHVRGMQRRNVWLVLVGASLLGAGVNIRESVAFYGLWLVAAPFAYKWKFGNREVIVTALACLLFFICALGPFAYYFLMDVGGYRAAWHGWVESMHMEEAIHPVTIRNFLPLFFFFFIAAPVILVSLPVAAYKEWGERGLSPILLMAIVGFIANMMLITHYSTVINGRYLLSGLPGLVPLTADYLMRFETAKVGNVQRAFWRVAGGVAFMLFGMGAAFFPFSWPTIQSHGITKEYRARLALLPRDAVVMAGGQTVAVTYWRGVGAGEWEVIGTGGGWPGERLPEVIETYLQEGRRVFVDTDPRLWFVDRWRIGETRGLIALESRFHFRRISETIYEIRPLDDETARDKPNLQRLLEKPPSKVRSLESRV